LCNRRSQAQSPSVASPARSSARRTPGTTGGLPSIRCCSQRLPRSFARTPRGHALGSDVAPSTARSGRGGPRYSEIAVLEIFVLAVDGFSLLLRSMSRAISRAISSPCLGSRISGGHRTRPSFSPSPNENRGRFIRMRTTVRRSTWCRRTSRSRRMQAASSRGQSGRAAW
jgi:hypothetical protein